MQTYANQLNGRITLINTEVITNCLDYTLPTGAGVRVKECPNCVGLGNSMACQITRKEDGFLWYCFRCRVSGFIPDAGASPSQVRAMLEPKQERKLNNRPEVVTLPDDFDTKLPSQALVDLYNFDVDDVDLSFYNLGYSAKHGRIIFPCYQWGAFSDGTWGKKLIGWAGKRLSTDVNPDKPKWHIVRQFDIKHLNYTAVTRKPRDTGKSVVIVEDPISAIRIANTGYMSIGLLTTYLPDTLLSKLRGWVVYMWLDQDAVDKAVKYIVKLGSHGITSRLITTKNDPKTYTKEEIIEWLN